MLEGKGKAKITADGSFARLEEMEKQKAIRLSELPLYGKIHAVYQTIGQMTEVSTSSNGRLRGRPQSEGQLVPSRRRLEFTLRSLTLQRTFWYGKRGASDPLWHEEIRKQA